ncbi:MAG: TolC family protein [Bacteroidetes bacterium]|nr:TolC family protein [Bacteroidota bacterium]
MKINAKYFISLIIVVALTSNAIAQTLTLVEARALTLSNNYGIQIQQLNSDITALQNSAGYAGMLPTISATAAYNTELTNSEQKYFSGDVRSVTNAGANAFDAGVYLNWTLFDGFAMFATRDKLNELAAKGELQLKNEIEYTMYDLNAAWYQMIQLQEAAEVNKKNIEVSLERYRIAKNRETLGAASHLDVLQAEVDLHTDSASLMQTNLQLKNTKGKINNIIGRDPATEFNSTEKITVNTDIIYSDVITKSIENNTELQIAKKDEAIYNLQVKEFKALLYPELNLTGGYGYLKSTSESGFVESNLNYGPSVGLSLNIPLFNGFTTSRNIDIAQIGQQIVTTQTQQLQLDINTWIYTLYNQYSTSLALMELEQRNIEAAQQNVTIALAKFDLGNITSVELREIQQALLNAQNRLLVETLNAKLAELQLMKISGQLPVN